MLLGGFAGQFESVVQRAGCQVPTILDWEQHRIAPQANMFG
jgi:hypothetical protein